MTVINTSPALHLSLVLPGGLSALPGLIGDVLVPLEVGKELGHDIGNGDVWQQMQGVPGIICLTNPVTLHPLLAAQLDAGEASVIQTALDEGLPSVILDERKARRVAVGMGLQVTSTMGIVLLAKKKALLRSVKDAVETLRVHGVCVDRALAERAVSLAGESYRSPLHDRVESSWAFRLNP